jgi:hypothetical protein
MTTAELTAQYTLYKYKTYTCSNYTMAEIKQMQSLIQTSTKFSWLKIIRPMAGNYKIFYSARYYGDPKVPFLKHYLISNSTRRRILEQIKYHIEHPEQTADRVYSLARPPVPDKYLRNPTSTSGASGTSTSTSTTTTGTRPALAVPAPVTPVPAVTTVSPAPTP